MNRLLPAGLLRLAQPYPWVVPLLALLGVLASMAEGLGIGLLIPVLDTVLGATPATSAAGPLAGYLAAAVDWIPADYRLPLLGGMIFLLIAVKTVLLISHARVAAWVNGRVAHDQRVLVASSLLESDYAYVSRLDQGQVISLFEQQSERAGEAMSLLCTLLATVSTVLVFTVLLALLSWQLTLVVAAVVLPVSLFVRTMTRRSRRLGEALVQTWAGLSTRILELVTSLRTVRLFGAEQAEVERLAAASNATRRAALRTGFAISMTQPLVELFYIPVFLAVLAVALRLGIGLPVLFAFLALLYRLQSPLKRLDHVRVELAAYAVTLRDLARLLDEAAARPAPSGSRPAPPLRAQVAFEQVSFRYTGGAAVPALDGVSLQIRRGEVVALVGASGSGKSTLVNLLCRLYEPERGRILVDGQPLAELDVASWRQRLAFAGQDSDLMAGTVRENITLGCPEATPDQIDQALRLASASDFVSALPGGLDAEVGPRGSNLSGGQRQRIALARAFIRQPELLILDEATSAVDNVTEAEIQLAIEALAGRTTILLIAHRLGTLRMAGRVIVLEAGRVAEQGTPAELLAADGLLARQHALE